MKRIRLLTLTAIALLLAALSPIYAPAVRAAGKPLLVVVSASAGIKDISTANLRRAFQGLPTDFEGGKRFIPLNHGTGTPSRAQFDRAVLGLEPNAVGAFWIDRRIRDESPPPRTVPTPDLALRIAGSLPGAITYIYPETLNATVKALTIDGKASTAGGYLLK
jgi:hypothetical protein